MSLLDIFLVVYGCLIPVIAGAIYQMMKLDGTPPKDHPHVCCLRIVLLRVGEQLSRELRLAEVRREIIRENMRHEMSVAMNLPRGLLESVTIVLADTIADRLSEVWDQAEHIQDEWFMDPDVGVPYFG